MTIKVGQIYKHIDEGILLITKVKDVSYFEYKVIKKNKSVAGWTAANVNSPFSRELELIDTKIAKILYGKL